jgi:hypothetical protein
MNRCLSSKLNLAIFFFKIDVVCRRQRAGRSLGCARWRANSMNPCGAPDASGRCCSSRLSSPARGADVRRLRQSYDRGTRAGSSRSAVRHVNSAGLMRPDRLVADAHSPKPPAEDFPLSAVVTVQQHDVGKIPCSCSDVPCSALNRSLLSVRPETSSTTAKQWFYRLNSRAGGRIFTASLYFSLFPAADRLARDCVHHQFSALRRRISLMPRWRE